MYQIPELECKNHTCSIVWGNEMVSPHLVGRWLFCVKHPLTPRCFRCVTWQQNKHGQPFWCRDIRTLVGFHFCVWSHPSTSYLDIRLSFSWRMVCWQLDLPYLPSTIITHTSISYDSLSSPIIHQGIALLGALPSSKKLMPRLMPSRESGSCSPRRGPVCVLTLSSSACCSFVLRWFNQLVGFRRHWNSRWINDPTVQLLLTVASDNSIWVDPGIFFATLR